ncbi:HAD-IIB family hydrolase [Stieleria varia]|uniref:Mannosylfructose-phosphate phosphatase n=1 Tax=Stieleria varia TaxID=2528005 RepID=A0A5C6A3R7_9BACT|nr:HAD-IIB family hydrolase [Stieleria varia]TWT93851.1 Mannosylfructose-phosphate phosphatase [Stieleria varia]
MWSNLRSFCLIVSVSFHFGADKISFIKKIRVLATDLDGTLIPLGNKNEHRESMIQLGRLLTTHGVRLWFVTGRSWELTQHAIAQYDLPVADRVICDVGTRILQHRNDRHVEIDDYRSRMLEILGNWSAASIQEKVRELGIPLVLQPPEKQTLAKISFDFPHDLFDQVHEGVQDWLSESGAPLSMVTSRCVDTGTGLLDLLPENVDKSYGLRWLLQQESIASDELVFAGDSGNDAAVVASGVNTILVGNADPQLRSVARALDRANIFQATSDSTSGVLQGIKHFILSSN